MADIVLLIPYYNNLNKLYKSLESISDLEPVDVLIVDDGSWEKPDISLLIEKFPALSKIEIITSKENEGLSKALNRGLEYIKKNYADEYIARLDVGDVCVPERFLKQKEFLDRNRDIYLVGSNAEIVNQNGDVLFIRSYPVLHEDIAKNMYVFSSFMHPAVMFRKKALEKIGNYPLIICQDYGFFFKFIRSFKTANLPELLLKYELNPGGITYANYRRLHLDGLKVIWNNFNIKFLWHILIGTFKRILCILLGPKIMIKLGTNLRLKGF